MSKVVVRYRVTPDQVERNEELVRAMYEELHRAGPPGFHYATFKLDDGVSFIHIALQEGEHNPLSEIAAAKEFQRDIADRCDEPPLVTQLTEIGSYEFWAG